MNGTKLTIIITIGVILGSLFTTVIVNSIQQYRAQQAIEAAADIFQKNALAAEQKRKENAIRRNQQLRRQRTSSQTGQKLNRACQDWRRAERQNSNYTTRNEMNQACNIYQHYLDTGNKPTRSFGAFR